MAATFANIKLKYGKKKKKKTPEDSGGGLFNRLDPFWIKGLNFWIGFIIQVFPWT